MATWVLKLISMFLGSHREPLGRPAKKERNFQEDHCYKKAIADLAVDDIPLNMAVAWSDLKDQLFQALINRFLVLDVCIKNSPMRRPREQKEPSQTTCLLC